MRIVVLGSGGSWPSPLRNVPALAVKMDPEVILVDCGEGTQRQLMSSSLSFMDIDKIFVTHFHGDHFLGIPGLIQSMAFNDRKEPLRIFGPEGIVELVDILVSIGHFRSNFEVSARVVEDGEVLDFGKYGVKAVRALHTVPSISYVIEERTRPGKFFLEKAKGLGIPPGPLYQRLQKGETITHKGKEIRPEMVMGPSRNGRKIIFSGDTLPTRELIEQARNCDVLVHDATVDSSLEGKANKYGHSSARQAAEVAKECNARFLLLTHISPRYEELEVLEKDAKAVFENVVVATDFFEYDVPFRD
jgi:ribonuclease Z